mmetsp:Transcript_14515/g.40881  ORF Transcript_14515/g.40881 Transcript_14515/m.40881 type:complete len:239 (+) Transcript_14515:1663-2379(+)
MPSPVFVLKLLSRWEASQPVQRRSPKEQGEPESAANGLARPLQPPQALPAGPRHPGTSPPGRLQGPKWRCFVASREAVETATLQLHRPCHVAPVACGRLRATAACGLPKSLGDPHPDPGLPNEELHFGSPQGGLPAAQCPQSARYPGAPSPSCHLRPQQAAAAPQDSKPRRCSPWEWHRRQAQAVCPALQRRDQGRPCRSGQAWYPWSTGRPAGCQQASLLPQDAPEELPQWMDGMHH